MSELGAYAGTVLAAYGATAVLLGGLIAWAVIRARRVARALAKVEKEQRRG